MKILCIAAVLALVASCANTQREESPVRLSAAILTLPSEAIAGMSKKGRREYLEDPAGDYDDSGRRIHYYADSSDAGGDPESMFFLRLFEDEDGRTISASHAARPFADGRDPSATDTVIYRLESGRWVDITDSVLPSGVSRSWWFRFNEREDMISCGPYVRFMRPDGFGSAYDFGNPEGSISWRDGRFHFKTKG